MGMSDWEQLQHILKSPIIAEDLLISDHSEWTSLEPGKVIIDQAESLKVVWRLDQRTIRQLTIKRSAWTDTEKALVQWAIAQQAGQGSVDTFDTDSKSDSERRSRALGEWIVQQAAIGDTETVPSSLAADGRLYAEMIPFLLEADHATEASAFGELQKLLASFLDEEVIVIPLKGQEWLVLAPVSLMRDTLDERDDQTEMLEDSLASIGSGLQEMLASEWIGECHLAVGRPIKPVKSIVQSVMLLHETIELGRIFEMGSNIHLPWNMHLERLLISIPENVRLRYVEQAFGRSDVFLEPETISTLETFFALDCNVSETAKKLYIHRNTLLYRLDKLKQESGLDVRVFREAVLMKIILLLYKVTKRT
jgi:sugar diacid utilization regulator